MTLINDYWPRLLFPIKSTQPIRIHAMVGGKVRKLTRYQKKLYSMVDFYVSDVPSHYQISSRNEERTAKKSSRTAARYHSALRESWEGQG